jgi:hypothetical protein
MVHVAIRYVSVQDVSKRVPFAIKMYKLPCAGFEGALSTLQMRVKSCERLLADFVFAEEDVDLACALGAIANNIRNAIHRRFRLRIASPFRIHFEWEADRQLYFSLPATLAATSYSDRTGLVTLDTEDRP